MFKVVCDGLDVFPLVQLPKKFKVFGLWTVFEEIDLTFPLVQLPKKFKGGYTIDPRDGSIMFPLVQLPKKFKAADVTAELDNEVEVSISSTSEEV